MLIPRPNFREKHTKTLLSGRCSTAPNTGGCLLKWLWGAHSNWQCWQPQSPCREGWTRHLPTRSCIPGTGGTSWPVRKNTKRGGGLRLIGKTDGELHPWENKWQHTFKRGWAPEPSLLKCQLIKSAEALCARRSIILSSTLVSLNPKIVSIGIGKSSLRDEEMESQSVSEVTQLLNHKI